MPRFLDRAAQAACWAARIAGLLLALLFLAFVIGESLPRQWTLQLALQFLCLFSIAAGLLLAWKWEGLGGLLTIAAFVLLCLTYGSFVSFAKWSPFTAIPAIVGLMHVLCWLRLRGASPGRLPVAVWALLGVFVALCANEIFGAPPLMTPSRPIAAMVGTWHSQSVVLTVAADGALSGRIDDSPVESARVLGNRSWFGRLMRWRTDSVVDGEGVTGFLWLAGTHLAGDVSTSDGRKHRFEVVR